jgi:alginate O-acetyltransferase complex protein AlgI
VIIHYTFFTFLIVGAVAYWLIPWQRLRVAFLTAVSLGFIALNDLHAAVVVVALAVYTFAAGKLIVRHRSPAVHAFTVAGLVGVLVVFKYLGFLATTLDALASLLTIHQPFHIEFLFLPLGISYIIFKYVSYLTDLHWQVVREAGSLVDVACYGALFTIFVAGPIERFERLAPQLQADNQHFQWNHADAAVRRIAYGLFKKVVIADWTGYAIASLAHASWTSVEGMVFLLGYSVQIYMDFAGYSDIAIGASRLFGITVMENFDWPYLQPNISRFWRHWHISLSDWIRDYLFFPLSRVSRGKAWTLVAVPLIAMGLCGLWHGPEWHFVAWGAWHGAGLSFLQGWNKWKRARPALAALSEKQWFTAGAVVLTFVFVTFGWVFFRG